MCVFDGRTVCRSHAANLAMAGRSGDRGEPALCPSRGQPYQALIQEHLVDPAVITDRLGTVNARYTSAIETATRWLAYQIDRGPA